MAKHGDRASISGSEYSPSTVDSDSESQVGQAKEREIVAGVDITHATTEEIKDLLREVEEMRVEADSRAHRNKDKAQKAIKNLRDDIKRLRDDIKRLKGEVKDAKNQKERLARKKNSLDEEIDKLLDELAETRFNRDHHATMVTRLFKKVAEAANRSLTHWDDPFELSWDGINRFLRSRFNIEMEQTGPW